MHRLHTATSGSLDEAARLTQAALHALRQDDLDQGERLLHRAVQADPEMAVAWLWLGALQRGARRSICLRWAQRSLPNAELPSLERLARHLNRQLPGRQLRRLLISGILVVTLLMLNLLEQHYRQRVYPSVALFGQSLGGATAPAALQQLARSSTAWAQTPLVVRVGSVETSIPLGALGYFDPQQLVDQALSIGHNDGALERMVHYAEALLPGYARDLTPALDLYAADLLIDQVAKTVERPLRPASFVAGPEGGWSIAPGQTGLRLDRTVARELLINRWAAHQWAADPLTLQIELPLVEDPLPYATSDLRQRLPQLQTQTTQPLVITWGDERRTFDRSALLDVAALPRLDEPFAPAAPAVHRLLQTLAAELYRPARPSHLVRSGDRVSEFALAQNGREVDITHAQSLILKALRTYEPQVELPLRITQPPPGEAEQLGLVAILGEGRSQFASYSSPDRDQNVLVGGEQFDGLLVPPGALISTDQLIGPITWERGYRMGEMISGGVVVPSLGGGICQVATTLYRTAFWSGLKIEERHNHDWRLPWYEVDAPPGMDATIALGGPDLKIRNTTDHVLLLKLTTDMDHKTQHGIIYGTPQGWQVTMRSSWENGTAVIDRRIEQNNTLIAEDRFVSVYW